MHRSTIAVAESAPCAMFVASIISQASLDSRPLEQGAGIEANPRPLFLGLVKEAIVHAVELQHGADLRLFQLVARNQPYLLSLSVQSG